MSIQLGFQQGDFGLRTWRSVAAEFIATGLFVFIGTGSVVAANAQLNEQLLAQGGGSTFSAQNVGFIIAVALAHGLAIALLVAATAKISGGHLNPAVTFAAVSTGRMKVSTGALYIGAQMVAAIAAAALLKGVIADPYESGLGAPTLNTGILQENIGDGALSALLVEGTLTFALVFVVFATAMDSKGLGFLAPIAIGLTVLVDHLIGIPLTGAQMNPARTFGPMIVDNFFDDWWIYLLGPLIGAAVAALVYEVVFIDRGGEDEDLSTAEAPPPATSEPAPTA
jgi:aquaporin TIP